MAEQCHTVLQHGNLMTHSMHVCHWSHADESDHGGMVSIHAQDTYTYSAMPNKAPVKLKKQASVSPAFQRHAETRSQAARRKLMRQNTFVCHSASLGQSLEFTVEVAQQPDSPNLGQL